MKSRQRLNGLDCASFSQHSYLTEAQGCKQACHRANDMPRLCFMPCRNQPWRWSRLILLVAIADTFCMALRRSKPRAAFCVVCTSIFAPVMYAFDSSSSIPSCKIWLEEGGGLFNCPWYPCKLVDSSCFKLFQAMAARRAASRRVRAPFAALAALWLVAADPCMILELWHMPLCAIVFYCALCWLVKVNCWRQIHHSLSI